MTLKFGAEKWFAFIISVLFLTDLVILLDIPVLRQIFGFLFLIILPGFLILQILKLNKIGFAEKFVLSVGLSIFFLMLFGLLLNNLSLSLDYKQPLATIPLLVSFNFVFVVLAIIGGYKRNKNLIFSRQNLNLSISEKAFLTVPILFPALSILGTHLMKTTDNNIILMFLLFLIPIYVVFVCFFNQKFSKRLYPVVILLISISLLLIFMLRFPHICGHDVHCEYGYFFQTTLDNLHWAIIGHSTLDACLSISLLPTIFQSILNVNAQEYLFKAIYVSICSFTPLAIYILSRKYIGDLYAFLASFFVMSQSTFLAAAGSPRTSLAIFFVALAVMVFFNDKIDPLKKRILFIVFMLSMVVSHYSTTYIFFFIILFCWLVVEILLRIFSFKKDITSTIVILFFAFIFFWYSQVTDVPFKSGVGFIGNTFSELNNFFIEESRAPQFKQLTGQELAYPILSRANLAFTWGTFILIGLGVLTMLKSTVKLKNPVFLKTKFEMEYLVMAMACSGLLVVMVALPFVSRGYGIPRLYSLVLVILSVCFVIGGMTLSHFLSKERTGAKKETLFACKKGLRENISQQTFKKHFASKSVGSENGSEVLAYLIILLILIPYFLFMSGAMYQIFGAPTSLNLNSEGKGYDIEYLHDSESCAAKWLMENAEEDSRINTADYHGTRKLMSQGKIPSGRCSHKYFFNHLKINGYIYLSYNNVVTGKLAEKNELYNMREYSDAFFDKSKIYDNRGSEVYL